ncbi:cytochrome f [Capsicum annuum]|nr:cytochrome f [Capsicum annuum]KAF3674989.1 cytochrome f [Capsicum annuum]
MDHFLSEVTTLAVGLLLLGAIFGDFKAGRLFERSTIAESIHDLALEKLKQKTESRLEMLWKEYRDTNGTPQLPEGLRFKDVVEHSFIMDEELKEQFLGLNKIYLDLISNGTDSARSRLSKEGASLWQVLLWKDQRKSSRSEGGIKRGKGEGGSSYRSCCSRRSERVFRHSTERNEVTRPTGQHSLEKLHTLLLDLEPRGVNSESFSQLKGKGGANTPARIIGDSYKNGGKVNSTRRYSRMDVDPSGRDNHSGPGRRSTTKAARSMVEFLGMVIREVSPRETPIQFLRELEKRLQVKHRIHILACHLRSAIHSKFRNLGNSIPIKELTKGMSGRGSLLDAVQLAETLGTAGVRSPQVSVLWGAVKHIRQGPREISLLHSSGRSKVPSDVQQNLVTLLLSFRLRLSDKTTYSSSSEIGFVYVSDHQTCDIDKIGVHAVGMPETTFSLTALASLATALAKAFFPL